MIANILFALVAPLASSLDAEPPAVLENEHLRIEFSARDGSIVRLRNRRAQLELVPPSKSSGPPWALLLAPADLVTDFKTFQARPIGSSDDGRLALRWETPYRITIKVEARLAKGSDELELRCSAENTGDRTIIAFRYPAIQGIGTLSGDGAGDRLLHSTMMGALPARREIELALPPRAVVLLEAERVRPSGAVSRPPSRG